LHDKTKRKHRINELLYLDSEVFNMANSNQTTQEIHIIPRRGGLSELAGHGPVSNFLKNPQTFGYWPDWFRHIDFRIMMLLYNTRSPSNMSHGLAVSRSVIAHNLGYASLNHIQERTDLLAEHGLIDIVKLDPSKEQQTRAGELLRISRMGILSIEGKMTFEDVSYRTEKGTTEIEEYSLEHIVREEFEKVFSVAWAEAKDEFKTLFKSVSTKENNRIMRENLERYDISRAENRDLNSKERKDQFHLFRGEILDLMKKQMQADRKFYEELHRDLFNEFAR